MEISAKITNEMILSACERRHTSLENPGFCILCAAEVDGVEPDAREYECECCGEMTVYGCEELLMETL